MPLGPGDRPLKVVMTGVSNGRRRALADVSAHQQAQWRRLGDAVKVDFYTESPSSVAEQAASLVKTLKSSSAKIEVVVGGTAIS